MFFNNVFIGIHLFNLSTFGLCTRVKGEKDDNTMKRKKMDLPKKKNLYCHKGSMNDKEIGVSNLNKKINCKYF